MPIIAYPSALVTTRSRALVRAVPIPGTGLNQRGASAACVDHRRSHSRSRSDSAPTSPATLSCSVCSLLCAWSCGSGGGGNSGGCSSRLAICRCTCACPCHRLQAYDDDGYTVFPSCACAPCVSDVGGGSGCARTFRTTLER